MQAILLVPVVQAQELLFLSNQFQQSMVQISLYQDQKLKDVQIVQDLERLVIKFSLFSCIKWEYIVYWIFFLPAAFLLVPPIPVWNKLLNWDLN